MIQKELEQLSTSHRDLRKFGVVVGGVFLLLGAFFLWRQKPIWPYLLTPGTFLVLLGLVAPRTLKSVYIGWMALAFVLGTVVSALVLSLCYFLIVTPLGIAGRLFGKDFLAEKRDPTARTYWLSRDRTTARKPSDYEQQF